MEPVVIVDDDHNDDNQGSETEIISKSNSPQKLIKDKTSQAWLHFTKDVNFKTNKKAVCNICHKVYKCSDSSTSNLSKHLKNHSIQIEENQKQGLSIAEMFGNKKVNFYLFIYLFFYYTLLIINLLISGHIMIMKWLQNFFIGL